MGPAELDLSVRFLTYSLAKGFDLGARDARCVGDKITTDAKLVELVTTKSFDALTHDEQATFFTRLDQYFKDCNLPLPS